MVWRVRDCHGYLYFGVLALTLEAKAWRSDGAGGRACR